MLLDEKFIWLCCAASVGTIDLVTLTFPCSTRCYESLYKKDLRIRSWELFWTIKTKPFQNQNHISRHHHSFYLSKACWPTSIHHVDIMIFTVLLPTSTMQSAISPGESLVNVLFVPHWTTIFCNGNGSGRLMGCHSTFSSPPMPKLIAFCKTIFSLLFDIVLVQL